MSDDMGSDPANDGAADDGGDDIDLDALSDDKEVTALVEAAQRLYVR